VTFTMFPSPEWASRLCTEANQDHYLREIGKGLSERIIVIVKDAPGGGDAVLYFRVEDGRCVEARQAEPRDHEDATVIVEADYGTWRRMLCWHMSPTSAYFQRRLRFRRGSLRALLRYPLLNYQLYHIASRVGGVDCGGEER